MQASAPVLTAYTHPRTRSLPGTAQRVLDAGLLGWSTVKALCLYTGYSPATVKLARQNLMSLFEVRTWEEVIVAARGSGIAARLPHT